MMNNNNTKPHNKNIRIGTVLQNNTTTTWYHGLPTPAQSSRNADPFFDDDSVSRSRSCSPEKDRYGSVRLSRGDNHPPVHAPRGPRYHFIDSWRPEPNRYTTVLADSTQTDKRPLPIGSWRSKFQGSSINVGTPASLIKSDNWRPNAPLSEAKPISYSNSSGMKQELKSPIVYTSACASVTPPNSARDDRVMPKHFATPLTCFYWATVGHCTKSDEDCWYAHRHTGVVAAAPVKLGDGQAVAGRQAETIMNEVHRQSDLYQRESTLRQRERDMDAKEALFERNAIDLQEAIRDILETVRELDAASTVAYKKLLRSSHDLHDIFDVLNIRTEIVVDKLSTGLLLLGPSIEAVNFAVKSMVEVQYTTREMCESVDVKSRK